ncbi:MAG TPA: class I SAM-dependent methyltransferase [Pseudacidobacterium sp.]|nr:class I SAM-dependent methyltransferase [Pseudacidobacterium sp.]
MPEIKRFLKNERKHLLHVAFELGQRCKVDILPRHFYSEIPDIHDLKNSRQWRAPRSFYGIPCDMDAQVDWVEQCTRNFRDKLQNFDLHKRALQLNGMDTGFGQVEADFLYCFVRRMRPARILQVGCGVSTAVCLFAAEDEGYTPEIICIEPYPDEFLKGQAQAGRIQLVDKKLQDVGFMCAEWLSAGDFFFVDSSHTLAPAGEVNVIVLEMLPRLAKGVYIHFHDIYFPYDYSPVTLSGALFFPHETALLYAFLLMNPGFEMMASLAMLHHLRRNDLLRFFPEMKPKEFTDGLGITDGHFPCSIYLHRCA